MHRIRRMNVYRPRRLALFLLMVLESQQGFAASQDLLNDPLSFSGAMLRLRPYTTMPGNFNDIISMTTRPGDSRLYVSTQEGTIFAVDQNPDGTGTATPWFDVADSIDQSVRRQLFGDNGQEGLQSTAFHPEFDNSNSLGYGKFYTTLLETRPFDTAGHHYLGSATSGDAQADSVLVEWTYNHDTEAVDALSYRELFRARLPVRDHMIKQACFNPYARPGDEDYGLLYITHGDSSSQQSTENRPQLLNFVAGKMLRIDPLASNGNPYSIPASNPYVGVSGAIEEIYATGFRNPHNFSFNQDSEGNVHILVGDIGRSNVEEVNLVVKGGNYGWTKREGTFVHLQGTDYSPPGQNAGYIWGVTNLAANEATVGVDARGENYIYPVAQWDHNDNDVDLGDDFTATAIATGFVINNGSDPNLQNQFIHNSFSFNHGDVYHNDFDDILNAVTQLDPGDFSRDQPSELTQAENFRLHLSFDDDNDPSTDLELWDDFNALLSGGGFARNDARFGEGVLGEMYISSKWTGQIYVVSNSIPYDADFDNDSDVDGQDFLIWQRNFGSTDGYLSVGDANHDGLVDQFDLAIWQDQFTEQGSELAASQTVPELEPALLLACALSVFIPRFLLFQRDVARVKALSDS